MRFTSVLLLASSVSAIRLQHRSMKPSPFDIVAKFFIEKCDNSPLGNGDGVLEPAEAKACYDAIEKELPEEVKEKIPELDQKDDAYMKKAAADGKITVKELAGFMKMQFDKLSKEDQEWVKKQYEEKKKEMEE